MTRTGFIGGSDLGSIVNAPPYGCARKLWYQKRAVEPDYEVPFRGHLLRGVKLEPLIVAEYVAKTGNKVRRRKASRGIADHEMGAMDRVILGDAVAHLHLVRMDEDLVLVLRCLTTGVALGGAVVVAAEHYDVRPINVAGVY